MNKTSSGDKMYPLACSDRAAISQLSPHDSISLEELLITVIYWYFHSLFYMLSSDMMSHEVAETGPPGSNC